MGELEPGTEVTAGYSFQWHWDSGSGTSLGENPDFPIRQFYDLEQSVILTQPQCQGEANVYNMDRIIYKA